MMYRVVLPPVVAVVTVLLVMRVVVLQMVGRAAGDATVHGNEPLLGLLEDPVKRNSIEVVQRLMVLLVLRIVRVMQGVMVLLVMRMMRVLEAMPRGMVPLVRPMVSAGVAMGAGGGGDACGDGAAGDVTVDGGAGNADGDGPVGDATGYGAAVDADGEGAVGDAPGDGEADDAEVRVLHAMQRVMVPLVVGMVGVLEVMPWFLLEDSGKGNIVEAGVCDGEGAVSDAPRDGATGDADGEGAAGDSRTWGRRCRRCPC